jgi:ABC-type sugar transport system, permease component
MTAFQKVRKYTVIFIKYFSLLFFTFVALVPIISCVITAFKTDKEYSSTSVMVLPDSWFHLNNFITAWKGAKMGLAFLNSAIILICVLCGSILFGSMLAYILNRFKFPGNGLIRNIYLFVTLIPAVATQVSVYKIMVNLHLVNSLMGYIILMMGTDVIAIYIFIQFFENISVSLDESAIMDGATYFGVFFKILFPLLKPAIITVMILKGVATYNEFYMSSLYLQDKKLEVVAICLYAFTGPMGSQYNLICAGLIITIIPALIIFILCQKQIYGGLTMGSVKG